MQFAAEEILTPQEVAKELKHSVRTVYLLVNSGVLPAIRTGAHSIRIERSALEAWKASRRTGRAAG